MLMYYSVGVYSVLMMMNVCVLCLHFSLYGWSSGFSVCRATVPPLSLYPKGFILLNNDPCLFILTDD